MLRLGFVDDDLGNYHADTFRDLLRTAFAGSATLVGAHALQADGGRAWCGRNQVRWYDDAADLTRDCDAVMVLAPGTPETHAELAARVLPAGLPTFIDKTFAASAAEARSIFALADRHRAPVQSCSVLRSSGLELRAACAAEPVQHVFAIGGGRSVGEYGVHPLELAVSLIGGGAVRALVQRDPALPQHVQFLLDCGGGRTATVALRCGPATAYQAVVTTAVRTTHHLVDESRLFHDGLRDILAFLADGRERIDRRETLLILRLLDLAAAGTAGWVELAP